MRILSVIGLAVFTPSPARRRPLSTVLGGDNGLVKASGSRGAMAPFEAEGKDMVIERKAQEKKSKAGSPRFDVDEFLEILKIKIASKPIKVGLVSRRGDFVSCMKYT